MRFHRIVSFLTLAYCCFALAAHAQQGAAGRSGESQGSLAPGMPIYAELKSGLDSKKAKNGDEVNAQTSEAVKSSDGRTILPKGTKLIGHVAQATAKSKGDGQSALGITFDKAILKDGGEVALSAGIQALASPASFSASSADAGPPESTANMGTTQTSPMGRSGPPANAPQNGAPDGRVAGPRSEQSSLGPNSRGVIGMNGLTLAAARVDNAVVSTVSSDGKNVHLDGGTRMLLVTQPGPETPAQ